MDLETYEKLLEELAAERATAKTVTERLEEEGLEVDSPDSV